VFVSPYGKTLQETCENYPHDYECEPRKDRGRFQFSDGSAIVAVGGGWDIEGKEKWSWMSCQK